MRHETTRIDARRRGDRRLLFAGIALMAAAAALLAAPSGTAQSGYEGQWTVDLRQNGRAQLNFNYSGKGGGTSMSGDEIPAAELRGLTADQARSGGTNVRFQIVRDAGTFDCEGWFRAGKGSGTFAYTASPEFAARLRSLGLEAPAPHAQFQMALADLRLELVEELKAQNYADLTTDHLVRVADHGVDLEYLRGLRAAGYQPASVAALVRMRDHGVTLKVISELEKLGYAKLPADQLVRVVDHGVSPSYIRELDALGYRGLPIEQLVRMRDHGVDSSYIEELRRAGLENLEPNDLVRMRDHGVTGAFAERAQAKAGRALAPHELIRLRNHGEDE